MCSQQQETQTPFIQSLRPSRPHLSLPPARPAALFYCDHISLTKCQLHHPVQLISKRKKSTYAKGVQTHVKGHKDEQAKKEGKKKEIKKEERKKKQTKKEQRKKERKGKKEKRK